jgi:hypothetical protein
LRSIAVTVEEPEPGVFAWVLLEQDPEWLPIKRGDNAVGSYAKAMAAGLRALQDMVDDLEQGPREALPETKLPRHAAFGFGFGGLK